MLYFKMSKNVSADSFDFFSNVYTHSGSHTGPFKRISDENSVLLNYVFQQLFEIFWFRMEWVDGRWIFARDEKWFSCWSPFIKWNHPNVSFCPTHCVCMESSPMEPINNNLSIDANRSYGLNAKWQHHHLKNVN